MIRCNSNHRIQPFNEKLSKALFFHVWEIFFIKAKAIINQLVTTIELCKHLNYAHSNQQNSFACGENNCFRIYGNLKALKNNLKSCHSEGSQNIHPVSLNPDAIVPNFPIAGTSIDYNINQSIVDDESGSDIDELLLNFPIADCDYSDTEIEDINYDNDLFSPNVSQQIIYTAENNLRNA